MFETEHLVQSEFETIYQRDYAVLAPDMRRLYENAKRDQWNVSKDIDWSTPVDLDKGIFADGMVDGFGSPLYEKLDAKTKRELNVEFSCWRLSQLLHGEEGAMLACSQLVDMVPTNDAKFFQSTQVVDEARHAEVLSRYLIEKCDGKIYPMSPNIKHLFDYLLGQGKWFIKTAGLQLVAETFAVGLFRMLAETSQDPLLKTIAKKILLDESRHMGFSVIGLPDMIASLSPSDFAELEDFTAEACRLVLRGQFPRPAFEKVGFSQSEIDEIQRYRVENAKSNDYVYFRQIFRREMYTQVVSNMKKVGLMSDRTRANLMKLGIDPNIDGRNATLEQQPGA
jgi:P-aminobenzoate N-oxygenase AurF